MDIEDIRLFLDVQEFGTITKAAENHFITQSAVSKRLAMLEKEMGVLLFLRGKGKTQAELTDAGTLFVDIARRMLNLYGQALELKKANGNITVACIDSVQSYSLPAFIEILKENYPELNITLENHHTAEILSLVRNHRVDIGIAHMPSSVPDIVSELLYKEEYRVVMLASDPVFMKGAVLSPEQLNEADEIYEDFGSGFLAWHDKWWDRYLAKVRVNVTSVAEHYFSSRKDWSIVPESVAKALEKRGFISYRLSPAPPTHEVYILYAGKEINEASAIFTTNAGKYFAEFREGKN